MLKKIALISFVLSASGSVLSADTQAFDIIERQISSLPYDSLSTLVMGDGIEITRLDEPSGNCIDLANSPVKSDVPSGAIEIIADINVISSVQEIEEKLNRSLGVEASASGSYLKVASGSVSTNFTEEFESFIQESSSSLMISVRISADHGRDWLDYKLKPEFQKLLDDGDFARFRALCGTHFVRAIKREAYLEYNITVSGLSSITKETLTQTARTNLEGKGGFGNVFSASGSASREQKFSSFLKTASQFGTVDINARLKGAPGIDSLAPALNNNVDSGSESLKALFSNLSQIAASFKDSNGVPTQMLLLRYVALPEFDASYNRFYVLGEITRKLLIVRSGLQKNEEIKSELPQMWTDYFEDDYEALKRIESALLSEYTRCYELEECSLSLPKDPTPLTISDILFDGTLRANCGMDAVALIGGSEYRVMSDIAVYWRGWMRFPNYIALADVNAFYLNGSLDKVETAPFEYQYDYSIDPNHLAANGVDQDGNRRKGPGRAIFQIVNSSFPLNQIVADGVPNEEFIKSQLQTYGDAVYGLSFRFSNGWVVSQLVGKPDLRQCRTLEKS